MRQRSMLGRAAPLNIEPVCEHEWKRYKQTVPVDNPNFVHMGAYFELIACSKCQKKLYTDYKVER